MTFSYDISLSTDLDKVRFQIQDTVSGSGPKPSGGNFQNEEISALLISEGTVERTIAALYETLSATWGRVAMESTIGPRSEKYADVSAKYNDLACRWREVVGYEPEWTDHISF